MDFKNTLWQCERKCNCRNNWKLSVVAVLIILKILCYIINY